MPFRRSSLFASYIQLGRTVPLIMYITPFSPCDDVTLPTTMQTTSYPNDSDGLAAQQGIIYASPEASDNEIRNWNSVRVGEHMLELGLMVACAATQRSTLRLDCSSYCCSDISSSVSVSTEGDPRCLRLSCRSSSIHNLQGLRQCCHLYEHDKKRAYGFRARAMIALFGGTSNVNWLSKTLNSFENSVSRAREKSRCSPTIRW